MYNRYLRNDDGVYTRVPMPDPPPESAIYTLGLAAM